MLRKSLSIAIVDARRRFGNGACIPAGPPRAPVTTQAAKTDVVILNGEVPAHELEQARAEIAGIFAGPVLRATVGSAGDLKWLNGARVLAYAGIANPERFFCM